MKKTLIILALFFSLNTAAYFENVVDNVKSLWGLKDIQKPEFSLIDTQGNIHTKASTDGKYLIVNFWATWCPPCRKELPAFVDFYEKNIDKVQVLGMNYERIEKNSVLDFVDTFLVSYPIILFNERNEEYFEKFGRIVGMPTTLIYDTKGNLITFHQGLMEVSDLEKAINLTNP
jgi:thiol-disulfide isomerase/thioredoxin